MEDTSLRKLCNTSFTGCLHLRTAKYITVRNLGDQKSSQPRPEAQVERTGSTKPTLCSTLITLLFITCIPQLAKLAFWNSNVATLANLGPNQKASKINSTQLPGGGRVGGGRRWAGGLRAVFLLMLVVFLLNCWSRIVPIC